MCLGAAGRGNIPLSKGMDVLWETGELAPLTSLDVRTLLEQELGFMRYGFISAIGQAETIISKPFYRNIAHSIRRIAALYSPGCRRYRAGHLTTKMKANCPWDYKVTSLNC